jgi:fumarate hydratase class II
MTQTNRTVRDSMGEMQVPFDALYGAQTARAVENFPISGWRLSREMIAAMGRIKLAAATCHRLAGRLDDLRAEAICRAAREVADGEHDGHFPVDVFQTGSGTSSHMNVNEVIAERATQLLAAASADARPVHPNDEVNRGQSSNDVFPTALHVAAADAIHHRLVPALRSLRDTLDVKADEFHEVIKIGRTHLMDAVPLRLGQEFRGYAAQVRNGLSMLGNAVGWLCELPIGGTAVGTGLTAPADLAGGICEILEELYNLPFRETDCHFDAQGARDAAVFTSGAIKTCATILGKIASDVRLMASGPHCGLGELKIPAIQPGSSIMPGKVNPVLCESVIQVACQVVGCDAAITAGATGGVGGFLELNTAMPMIASNLLTSVGLLANVTEVFDRRCLAGLEADAKRCNDLLERSSAIVTALAPEIGYDRAAEIAYEAHRSGRTIREICRERQILEPGRLEALLDPRNQCGD